MAFAKNGEFHLIAKFFGESYLLVLKVIALVFQVLLTLFSFHTCVFTFLEFRNSYQCVCVCVFVCVCVCVCERERETDILVAECGTHAVAILPNFPINIVPTKKLP